MKVRKGQTLTIGGGTWSIVGRKFKGIEIQRTTGEICLVSPTFVKRWVQQTLKGKEVQK